MEAIDNLFIGTHDQICCYCQDRKSEILYAIDHRDDAVKPEYGHYLPLCGECAKHLALGILRDVAALKVGEEVAQKVYCDFLERIAKK